MALRLIETIVPEAAQALAERMLEDQPTLGVWSYSVGGGRVVLRVLIAAENSESTLDRLEQQFSSEQHFAVLVVPVEAALPRPELARGEATTASDSVEPGPRVEAPGRISREELYQDVLDASRLTRMYVLMVVLSSIVASIGLVRSNVAVVIGAMVIAPLLGPNVALSLATALGDVKLGLRALEANFVGLVIAFALSACLGLVLHVSPDVPEIASRAHVGLGDVALALASGAAGALSVTQGLSTTLIGVMVAVALLPPLVTFGLLLGSGHGDGALGAFLLLVTNVICVNLSGVLAFVLQGIRPLRWWEADRAKRATTIAMCLWVLLLSGLVALILWARRI